MRCRSYCCSSCCCRQSDVMDTRVLRTHQWRDGSMILRRRRTVVAAGVVASVVGRRLERYDTLTPHCRFRRSEADVFSTSQGISVAAALLDATAEPTGTYRRCRRHWTHRRPRRCPHRTRIQESTLVACYAIRSWERAVVRVSGRRVGGRECWEYTRVFLCLQTWNNNQPHDKFYFDTQHDAADAFVRNDSGTASGLFGKSTASFPFLLSVPLILIDCEIQTHTYCAVCTKRSLSVSYLFIFLGE